MKAIYLWILVVLGFVASPCAAQKAVLYAPATPVRIPVPRVNVSPPHAPITSSIRTNGYPTGPALLPYPTISTPSNDAFARQNAWTAYSAQLHRIPMAPNPNRLAARPDLLDQNRLIQAPTSTGRYNFQYTDNEIRSVQAALRVRGIYSGQVDGILGPDTQRAIKTYQLRNKHALTGQPDAWLNTSLGILQ